LDSKFVDAVKAGAPAVGIPDFKWLMAVMDFETGGTFDPSIQNKGNKATGLIQAVGSVAAWLLGYKQQKDGSYLKADREAALERFRLMSREEQLEKMVWPYFRFWGKRIPGEQYRNIVDVAIAVFLPAFLGKPMDFPVIKPGDPEYEKRNAGAEAYRLNKGLDRTGKGYITVADYAGPVIARARKNFGYTTLDPVELVKAIKRAKSLDDLLTVTKQAQADNPLLAERWQRTVDSLTKVRTQYPGQSLDQVIKTSDIDWRTWLENTVRGAYQYSRSFEPGVKEFVRDVVVKTAVDAGKVVATVGENVVGQIGIISTIAPWAIGGVGLYALYKYVMIPARAVQAGIGQISSGESDESED